jgi:hypothetical protein
MRAGSDLPGPRPVTGSRKHARCLACRIGRPFHSKLLTKKGVRHPLFHSKPYPGGGTDIPPLKTSFARRGQTSPTSLKPFYERKPGSDPRPPLPFHPKPLVKEGVRPLLFHSKPYPGGGTDIPPLKTSFARRGLTSPFRSKPFYERRPRSDPHPIRHAKACP